WKARIRLFILGFTRLARIPRPLGVIGLTGLIRFAGFTRLPRLAGIARLPGFVRPTGFARLAGFARFIGIFGGIFGLSGLEQSALVRDDLDAGDEPTTAVVHQCRRARADAFITGARVKPVVIQLHVALNAS